MRVRFVECNDKERKAVSRLDRRIQQIFEAAIAHERDQSWWCSQFRKLAPNLDVQLLTDRSILLKTASRTAMPLAERIARQAPRVLRVLSSCPALPLELALSQARALGFDFSRSSARAGFVRGHLLEIALKVPGANGSESERAAGAAFVCDLLGQRLTLDWVNAVHVVPGARGGALRVLSESDATPTLSLAELLPAVEASVRAVHEGLPALPSWQAGPGEWTMFELEPSSDGDWPEQDDLVMATTCVPELLKCGLQKAPFSSVRFSRHGEQFLYLKYEAHGAPEERLRRRTWLEDELDRELLATRGGRVLGGGLGLRYAYVHFAISNDDALRSILRIGREAELPERSWILPFDGDLAEEWLELWPSTPAPPLAHD